MVGVWPPEGLPADLEMASRHFRPFYVGPVAETVIVRWCADCNEPVGTSDVQPSAASWSSERVLELPGPKALPAGHPRSDLDAARMRLKLRAIAAKSLTA